MSAENRGGATLVDRLGVLIICLLTLAGTPAGEAGILWLHIATEHRLAGEPTGPYPVPRIASTVPRSSLSEQALVQHEPLNDSSTGVAREPVGGDRTGVAHEHLDDDLAGGSHTHAHTQTVGGNPEGLQRQNPDPTSANATPRRQGGTPAVTTHEHVGADRTAIQHDDGHDHPHTPGLSTTPFPSLVGIDRGLDGTEHEVDLHGDPEGARLAESLATKDDDGVTGAHPVADAVVYLAIAATAPSPTPSEDAGRSMNQPHSHGTLVHTHDGGDSETTLLIESVSKYYLSPPSFFSSVSLGTTGVGISASRYPSQPASAVEPPPPRHRIG